MEQMFNIIEPKVVFDINPEVDWTLQNSLLLLYYLKYVHRFICSAMARKPLYINTKSENG